MNATGVLHTIHHAEPAHLLRPYGQRQAPGARCGKLNDPLCSADDSSNSLPMCTSAWECSLSANRQRPENSREVSCYADVKLTAASVLSASVIKAPMGCKATRAARFTASSTGS